MTKDKEVIMRIWKRLLLRLAKIVNVLLVTASIMLFTVSYITRMGNSGEGERGR